MAAFNLLSREFLSPQARRATAQEAKVDIFSQRIERAHDNTPP
jgi:hypothetical protein